MGAPHAWFRRRRRGGVVTDPQPAHIRDAATLVLLRRREGAAPQVLMGMRGAAAAFMPSKYVFPGGAVDPEDAQAPIGCPIDPRLAAEPRTGSAVCPGALLACAARELTEETGLTLRPDAAPLFLFRAITPPGRPRRFDARFFVIDAADIAGDPEDFSAACDELSHLHWVPLPEIRQLDLPFITEVVLAEVAALADAAGAGPLTLPATVPFFDNRDAVPRFVQLA